MARKETATNGHDRLEEAIAILLQNQAAFVGQLAETRQIQAQEQSASRRLHDQLDRETKEHIARIDSQFADIIRVLNEHSRMIQNLTDAVREKIGFKGQP